MLFGIRVMKERTCPGDRQRGRRSGRSVPRGDACSGLAEALAADCRHVGGIQSIVSPRQRRCRRAALVLSSGAYGCFAADAAGPGIAPPAVPGPDAWYPDKVEVLDLSLRGLEVLPLDDNLVSDLVPLPANRDDGRQAP